MKTEEQIEVYTMIHIISHQNLSEFKRLCDIYCEGKKIIRKRIGASAITMPSAQGMGVMMLPYMYIEHECTREEHRAWKYGQTIKLT